MKKQETPLGFKLIRAYFVIIALLNIFDLFKGGIETLTTLLVLIVIGVIVFSINKRYKFGQYVVYAVVLYSIIPTLVRVITLLTSKELSNKFQQNIANLPVDFLSKALYFSIAIILVYIIINIMIFYYTYKHRNYFVN